MIPLALYLAGFALMLANWTLRAGPHRIHLGEAVLRAAIWFAVLPMALGFAMRVRGRR